MTLFSATRFKTVVTKFKINGSWEDNFQYFRMSQQDLYLMHQLVLYTSLEEVSELYHTLVGLYCVSVLQTKSFICLSCNSSVMNYFS
jgi:hypothetical protein